MIVFTTFDNIMPEKSRFTYASMMSVCFLHHPVALRRLVERRGKEEGKHFGIPRVCCLIG